MAVDPPTVLPYADTTTPTGVEGLQIVRVHDDVRRVIVPASSPSHRGVAFEVTPFAFRMTVAGPFGLTRSAWPRSALLEVRLNRLSNQLVLRLAGQDPLEVGVAATLAATELVMHELIASLTVIPAAPPHQQQVSIDTAGGLPPSPLRSLLFAMSVGLMALGVVCLFIPPHVPGCYVFGLAAVPAGIAFGTQRKERWP